MASDYPLPEASVRRFAERREFRFGDLARDAIAKASRLFVEPDRIAELRGRLDKALGREQSTVAEAKRAADRKPGQERDTDAAANRLRVRMAELGRQVRKDDEKERDRTRERDRERGPER